MGQSERLCVVDVLVFVSMPFGFLVAFFASLLFELSGLGDFVVQMVVVIIATGFQSVFGQAFGLNSELTVVYSLVALALGLGFFSWMVLCSLYLRSRFRGSGPAFPRTRHVIYMRHVLQGYNGNVHEFVVDANWAWTLFGTRVLGNRLYALTNELLPQFEQLTNRYTGAGRVTRDGIMVSKTHTRSPTTSCPSLSS